MSLSPENAERSYSDAIAQLETIRHAIDDLIGMYGVEKGQAGWFIVVRARDQLLRLEGDFDRLNPGAGIERGSRS